MARALAATTNRPVPKPSKIRYFRGKAPTAAAASSDEDDSDAEVASPEPVKVDRDLVAGGAGRVVREPAMKVALKDVKVENGRGLMGGKAEVKPGRWTMQGPKVVLMG